MTIAGQVQTAAFNLLSLSGETIKPVMMTVVSSTNEDHEYVGTFDLPKQPLHVAVSGEETTSRRYQRVFHTLFHAETVDVVPLETEPTGIRAGMTSSIPFIVRNVGEPATFRIVVADTRRFVTRIDPQELTLASGASGRVTVDLAVPADTPAATGLDLTVTATSTSGSSTTNGIVRHLAVMPALNR